MVNETKFCSNCGAEIAKAAEICPKCGVRVKAPVKEKNPGLSAVLEFVPGLFGFLGIGHIYNGNFGKGIIFLVGYWIFLAVELLLMFVLIGFLLLPVNLIIIFISAYLAYNDAKS